MICRVENIHAIYFLIIIILNRQLKIIKIFFNIDLLDTQCGFKLFNGLALRKLMSHSVIKKFCIDVEILFWTKVTIK